MGLAARAVNWPPLRDAFVKRDTRPTYEDLSAEFGVPLGSIARCAADEAWPALRARYLESQLQASDAANVLLAVVKGDQTISTGYLSLAVTTLAKLQSVMDEIPADRAAGSKADVINTCMFAAKNLADALKAVGIIGAGKILASKGQEDNGRWNQDLVQQINVTVATLQSKADAVAAAPTGPTVTVTPTQTAEQPAGA